MNDKIDEQINYIRAQFPGEIITIDHDDAIKDALELIKGETFIGFDTETKPSFKKGEFYQVSLLQLATPDHALLFRLQNLKKFSMLTEFFEQESILKIGVATRDDIKALQRLFPFTPRGFIELSDLAKTHQLKNYGLKGLTEEVLDLTLSKKAKLSNWESKDLKEDQKIYAATDAWIGREIYLALQHKG